MNELKVGVIGCGYTGKLHAEAYQKVQGVKLVSAADSDTARVSSFNFGVRRYTDYRELLESDVDAVSICLPTYLHHDVAVAALERGKHVFLEKPIAVTMEEARAMLRASRASQRTLFVGMTHRFYPELREAKKLVEDGAIGDIIALNDSILEHFGFLQSPPWYLDKNLAGGGVALTSGIHLVDRLRWFAADEIAKVAGNCGNPYFHAPVEDSGQMYLQFRSGISAQITMAFMRDPHPLVCDLQVIGTRGTITVHTWKGYDLHNAKGDTAKVIYTDESHAQKVLIGMCGEAEEFCSSIREGRTPWPSVEESARGLEIILAYYKSAETGGWISV